MFGKAPKNPAKTMSLPSAFICIVNIENEQLNSDVVSGVSTTPVEFAEMTELRAMVMKKAAEIYVSMLCNILLNLANFFGV